LPFPSLFPLIVALAGEDRSRPELAVPEEKKGDPKAATEMTANQPSYGEVRLLSFWLFQLI
jgi:hypothetical protein